MSAPSSDYLRPQIKCLPASWLSIAFSDTDLMFQFCLAKIIQRLKYMYKQYNKYIWPTFFINHDRCYPLFGGTGTWVFTEVNIFQLHIAYNNFDNEYICTVCVSYSHVGCSPMSSKWKGWWRCIHVPAIQLERVILAPNPKKISI